MHVGTGFEQSSKVTLSLAHGHTILISIWSRSQALGSKVRISLVLFTGLTFIGLLRRMCLFFVSVDVYNTMFHRAARV